MINSETVGKESKGIHKTSLLFFHFLRDYYNFLAKFLIKFLNFINRIDESQEGHWHSNTKTMHGWRVPLEDD